MEHEMTCLYCVTACLVLIHYLADDKCIHMPQCINVCMNTHVIINLFVCTSPARSSVPPEVVPSLNVCSEGYNYHTLPTPNPYIPL